MLDKDIRTAILALSRKGYGVRRIARELKLSRNSVRRVIQSGVVEPAMVDRGSQLEEHLEEIRSFYEECQGNLVRVREKLEEALLKRGQTLQASYSALTWFCRRQGIGVKEPVAVRRIVTAPGLEMQHDTSPHTVLIAGNKVKRQCASLVLGYSRMLYMQFYPRFQRFHMKMFLTDAFKYFGGCCERCVIDHTSIAIVCGTGHLAEVAPEVEAFERRFGFKFLAHELGHKERSGKIERPFHYIEHNFLAGRVFKDDEDLNRQALEWLERANRRQLRELKANPIELFAAEKPHLVSLPLYVPEAYRVFQRVVDAYGCVSVERMKYPAPTGYIGKTVLVCESKDAVRLFDGHKELAAHKKKIEGSPAAQPAPNPVTRRQRQAWLPEEQRLKEIGPMMPQYLQALKAERGSCYVWSVKKLYRLLCQYDPQTLERAVAKAAEHHLFDVRRIETILLHDIAEREYRLPLEPQASDYEDWPQYRQGAATPEPDLKLYAPDKEQDDEKEKDDAS
jgi:predicted transcriptional regulator